MVCLTSDIELTHDIAYGYKSSFPDRGGYKSRFALPDFLSFKHSIVKATLAHPEQGHAQAHAGCYSSTPVNTLGHGSLVVERFP